MLRSIRYVVGLIFVLLASSGFAAETVKYRVEINDPNHHYAEVAVLFPKTEQQHLDIIMPSWRLGYYKILDLANGIRHMSATDSNGNNLPIQKINKYTWRVQLDKPTKVAVTYQLYANLLARRARHIDDSHAFLDGVSSFVYSEEFIESPIQVELDVPKGWRSRSGMKSTGRHRFEADSYHILASSPIESGFHEFHEFKSNAVNFELVIWGKGNFNVEKIIKDYKTLVAEMVTIWGDYPFDRYLFIIHVADGLRGATEHINSNVHSRSPMSFDSEDEHLKFLSTTSHELIHIWNVKAYRPVGVHAYDYTQENYSDLLWISEGSTSYFSDLILTRAGLMTVKKYLASLAENIKSYQDKPGTKVMTVQQASFDAWIEGGGHRGLNDGVGIYSKGEILSLMMDLTLIKDSQGKSNYGDLHRLLYQRFPVPEIGFSALDIQNLMTELSGQDYTSLWSDYMEGTEDIDFNGLLNTLGLVYHPYGKTTDDKKQKINTGIVFIKNTNKLASVARNSDAWNAGLTENDVILALDGAKVVTGHWADILSSYKAGDEVRVTYFRGNILKESQMQLSSNPEGKASIEFVQQPTEQQKTFFKLWSGQDWPTGEKELATDTEQEDEY